MNGAKLHKNDPILIKNIHDFLKNGDKQIRYSPNKDIVLLLGNTGSGKSTLTLYISDNANKLWSKEVGEDTGQYVIIDKQNKVSNNSTIVSQTIYPDLVEDTKTNTLYYDCPGFSDTRSAAHEIAATYFIKKVIDSAKSVKIVFVVSHNSVSTGEDRKDFILMLQHATDFVKQIEKFKDSIALIVTKIENRYVRNQLVSDEKVIKAIGNYLDQAKRDIDRNPEMVTSPGQPSNTKEKVISLLDIFLSKGENQQYTRIGIFRKPNEPGQINEIELMKEGKISLQNMINKNIQFVAVGDNDFGYTVSAKSKVHINDLVDEINKTILEEIIEIGNEVITHSISLEEKYSELDYLKDEFQELQESFTKLQHSALKDTTTVEFINEIDNNVKYFKINISDNHIKTMQKEGDYISFLNQVSNQSIKSQKSSILASGLSHLIEYLNDSHSFYRFLNNMYKRLSEFDIQKKRKSYITTNIKEIKDLHKSSFSEDIEGFLKEHSNINEIKLNKHRLKLLNRVLEETLYYKIKVESPEIDEIVVKGVNIKLSDIKELLENKSYIKFVQVYALNKVFIDISLDLTGREIQIAIVGPEWEIIGNQRIILDGKSGMDYYPQKARKGDKPGESGFDGQPGDPGGPAGNFIGIGKHFINEEYLHISANGGKGGRGQDGGDGSEGLDGSQCKKEECTSGADSLITVFYNKADADYRGQVGGNGGNGGIGGYGGDRGTIYIVKVGAETRPVQAEQTALDGLPGRNGEGGDGGKGGRYYHFKVRNYVLFFQNENFEPINKWAQEGKRGKNGANILNRKNTWHLRKLINLSKIKMEYKNYLQHNIENNLQETFLTTFLSDIDNNHSSVTNLKHRTRRYINNSRGFTEMEEQMKRLNKYKLLPKATQTQSYDHYSNQNMEHYYLDFNYYSNNSTAFNRPTFSKSFLETEKIMRTPLKTFFTPKGQLEIFKSGTQIKINNQYSSDNLHGNLILSEMVMKKILGKVISSKHNYKKNNKKEISSAHDLAYRHYVKDTYPKNILNI